MCKRKRQGDLDAWLIFEVSFHMTPHGGGPPYVQAWECLGPSDFAAGKRQFTLTFANPADKSDRQTERCRLVRDDLQIRRGGGWVSHAYNQYTRSN